MKIIKAILATIILLSTLLSPLTHVHASTEDILLTNNLELRYSFPNEFVEVSETQSIKINNSKYFYRSGLEQTFFIPNFINTSDESNNRELIKNTIKLSDSNELELSYTLTENSNGIEITTATTSRITSNNQYHIKLTYQTANLVSINGNIANIYVPGLPKDSKTEVRDSGYGFTVRNEYSASLLTNKDAPAISHIQPKSVKVENLSNSIKYTIPTADRIGSNSWVQLGTNQYYYFRLEQEAKQTDFVTPPIISEISDLISSNIYRIALPREYNENNQKVYIKNISPTPYKIERDEEGNIFALFRISANSSKTITIEGYIQQSKPSIDNQSKVPQITVAEYKGLIANEKNLDIYLKEDKYWEINDPNIKDIANKLYPELYEDTETLESLIRTNYRYVVDSFDYDYDKLTGENKRLGAKSALQLNKGVCMEYSDALTAIFRAQGIPARIAIGYGNDPTGAENKISNTQPVRQRIAHQWTQVWIPDFGWLSIDPTWGESEREYIGSDLDHILWYTVGSFDERIADTTVYTADSISSNDIGEYKVYLHALKENDFEKIEGLRITSDLLNEYENKPNSQLDFILRTSTYGRILVYIIPAVTVFSLVLIVTALVKSGIKRFRQASQG